MRAVILILGLGLAFLSARAASGEPRSWHQESGYRWADLAVPAQGRAGFTELGSGQTAILFTNLLTEWPIATNRVMANGSGVATGDFDHDGLPDVFFCGLESRSLLYRNLGHWKFQDVTAEAGLAFEPKPCRGAVFADVNGDGHLDLLVSTLKEGVLCFINDGRGTFSDRTAEAGTRSSYGSTTMALADIDGNGTLDLYVANYRPNDIRDQGRVNLPAVKGRPVIPPQYKDRFVFREGQLSEYGQPDQLFLNDGKGRFRPVVWNDGTFLDESGQRLTEPPLDWGLSAAFQDMNGDFAPDLYVCNDYWTPDRFWINDGHGHFRAAPKLALRQISSSSMAIDFADVDRDGQVDFFVAEMLSRDLRLRKRQMLAERPEPYQVGAVDNRPQILRNTLFRNRGDGTFAELANYGRVSASDWSWCPIFLDVDLDGLEDLLISAGHFHDVQDLDAAREIQARQHPWTGFKDEAERQKAFARELFDHYRLYPPLDMPIVSFRNLGNWMFEETTDRWGLSRPGVHQGSALADFDLDGDLDLVVNNLNGLASVCRNETPAGRVAVRLKGTSPNTQGIGAKITLRNGAIPSQSKEMVAGGRYLSGSEPMMVFASGLVRSNMMIEVRWRNGGQSRLADVRANRIYEIDEAGALPASAAPADAASGQGATVNGQRSTLNAQPFFQDVSAAISHTHSDPEFDDFARQPLLPFRLSQPGPGVAWFDLDGDGHDDLIIGSGSGGVPAVFRSDGRGAFTRVVADSVPPVASDLAGIVGWADGSGGRFLLAGVTGYEAQGQGAAVRYGLKQDRLNWTESLAREMTSGGALALGDFNGDGPLALFVAGGVSPGRYPLGGASKLYRWIGGQWQLDVRNSVLLDNLGIINGAVWSDLTGDGIPELILACEWGPIRVFRNQAGSLFDATAEFGLSGWTGWWKGITTGDIDGDGRLDVIAANWGLNSPYQADAQKPLVLCYGQLAQPGVLDLIETGYDPATGSLAPRRPIMALAKSLPFLLEQFSSHKAYAEATLDQVLGDRRVLGRRIEVTTLSSMLFLNRGNRFEAVPLPGEARFAPAFSVNVADFDGDGHDDVFLSQNFFATPPETPRLDAGRGLWLRGDGTGRLSPVSGSESGIQVYGEQRGAALADFDGDGRMDLAVSQNGGATKLYRNRRAAPGLRVKLRGSPGNPDAINAVMRLQFGDRPGPVREIHAGSGYWSQDAATQVLAVPESPTALWIRWPGGRVTTTPLPAAAKEVTVDSAGKLVSSR